MASLYRVGAMVGVFMCEVFAVSNLEFSIYKCGKELTELDAKLEKCLAFIKGVAAELHNENYCQQRALAIPREARELLKEIGEAW